MQRHHKKFWIGLGVIIIAFVGMGTFIFRKAPIIQQHTNHSRPTFSNTSTPGWIISTAAIEKLKNVGASDTLINTAFNTNNSYVTGKNNTIGIPTASYTSYQAIANAFAKGILPGKYKAVLYDNENWPLTPLNEKQQPLYYEALVADRAHAHHMLYIATPANDIVQATGKLIGENDSATYLARKIPYYTAQYADIVDIQAQFKEDELASFTKYIEAAAKQVHEANPHTKVFIGISTNPSGKQITDEQLYAAYNAAKSFADGFWLNIPQAGSSCPKCGVAQPQIALYLLQKIYMKQ